MVFDIGAWLIGQALAKSLGKILALGGGDSLQARLEEAAETWASGLSQGEECSASAILNFDEELLAGEPPEEVQQLQDSIRASGVPSAEAWTKALLANYRCIKERQGQEAQDFFLLDEGRAGELLSDLGTALHRVCVQDEALFKSGVFQLLAEIVEKVDGHVRSGQVDHDLQVLDRLQGLLPHDPTMKFFKDHGFGNSFASRHTDALLEFVHQSDSVELEFIDPALNKQLSAFKDLAQELSTELMTRTVPVGGSDSKKFGVFPDRMRKQGQPRSEHVLEDARVLNSTSTAFVSAFDELVRACRTSLHGER